MLSYHKKGKRKNLPIARTVQISFTIQVLNIQFTVVKATDGKFPFFPKFCVFHNKQITLKSGSKS